MRRYCCCELCPEYDSGCDEVLEYHKEHKTEQPTTIRIVISEKSYYFEDSMKGKFLTVDTYCGAMAYGWLEKLSENTYLFE